MMKLTGLEPAEWREHWANIPQDNCGDFYFKVKSPLLGIPSWHQLKAHGQLCCGTDMAFAVACQLWNDFPNRGRGGKYVAWRAEPYNPELCKFPRTGVVDPPKVRRTSDAYSFDPA